MNDSIYQRPNDYELEHYGDDRDVTFYGELLQRHPAKRLLELASGSGRLTLPLARQGFMTAHTIVAVELEDDMIALGRQRAREAGDSLVATVTFEQGDMRSWHSPDPFDAVLVGCSSITHLLTLDDRLATWRNVHGLLTDEGRFIVDVTMPDIRTYSSSLESPPRAMAAVDLDREDAATGERLVRSKTTTYDAWLQRAKTTFLYDKFQNGRPIDRYISDFESHVYYPDELRLLFLHTGFEIEEAWADYTFKPPHSRTREVVIVARKRGPDAGAGRGSS